MLGSLWPDRAAAAAFLLAVRLGTFPDALVRQVGAGRAGSRFQLHSPRRPLQFGFLVAYGRG